MTDPGEERRHDRRCRGDPEGNFVEYVPSCSPWLELLLSSVETFTVFILFCVRCFPLALIFPQLWGEDFQDNLLPFFFFHCLVYYRITAEVRLSSAHGNQHIVQMIISGLFTFSRGDSSLTDTNPQDVHLPFLVYGEFSMHSFLRGLFCNHLKMFLWSSAKVWS